MVITQILGNIHHQSRATNKKTDELFIEWFETNKRIQHLKTEAGQPIIIQFMGENQFLSEGDLLFEDENQQIIVRILPCEVIILEPKSILEMGAACYEVGNKHVPVFMDSNRILMPYEEPMFKWLSKNGYQPKLGKEALINKLSANVEHHHH